MAEDPRVRGDASDALPRYTAGDADDTVTVSLSTAPGEWLVNTMDAVVVPMSMTELVDALQKRKLTERSLVWRAGMQEWAPVDHVPQLKLVARLGATLPGIAPSPASEPSRPASLKPPPKPVRATPAPPSVVPNRLTPVAVPTVTLAQPPRKTPLAFAPPPVQQAETGPKSSSKRTPSEDPEALAVYARPAATASFDLSPEPPLRGDRVSRPTARPSESTALETLSPLTSDSAPRLVPTPRSSDLSVVAAAHFRAVQRSSKRLILISSLASAAVASLVTYWIAHSPAPNAAAPEAPPAAITPPAPAPALPTAPPTAAANSVETAGPSAASSAPARPAAPPVSAKSHPVVRRTRPSAASPVRPRPSASPEPTPDLPSSEPNPYDAKADPETARPVPKPAATESPADAEKSNEPEGRPEPSPSNSDSTNSGF